MVRAAQTIEPLSKLLAAPVQFRPDTFEIGGIYSKGTDGERITGKTNTAAELQARFPKYDVRALPSEGMWYTQGFETRPQATVRAAKVIFEFVVAAASRIFAQLLLHEHVDSVLGNR